MHSLRGSGFSPLAASQRATTRLRAVNVGSQLVSADPGQLLDLQHPLDRDAGPLRDRLHRDAQLIRERLHRPERADCTLEPVIYSG